MRLWQHKRFINLKVLVFWYVVLKQSQHRETNKNIFFCKEKDQIKEVIKMTNKTLTIVQVQGISSVQRR